MSVEQSAERPRDEGGRFTQPADSGLRSTEISSAMADSDRPFDAFTPMERAQPAEKSDSYRSDSEGLKSAAQELTKRRQEAEQNAPVVPRRYHTGSDAAKPVRPITETVKLKEAARDLHGARQAESDANDVLRKLSLAQKLDLFRQQADAEDRGEPAPQEAQPVPQPQPTEAPPEAPQQQTNGVHPDVAAALQNPHVRAALEQEATAHATARQQYLQSVQMMGNAAWANVMAQFPEMQQGNTQQVLEQMRTTNPQRFAEITGHLQRVEQIGLHWQQLRAQQHQQQVAQWHANANAQDQHYQDFAATRSAAENKMVQEHLSDVLKAYDINEADLRAAWNANHPLIRSSAFQRMLHDLAVLHAARKASGHKAPADIPRVQRPGEAQTGGTDNSALAAAMRAFNADPNNPRLAAKALTARRKAAAGLR